MKRLFTLLTLLFAVWCGVYSASPKAQLPADLKITGLTEKGKALRQQIMADMQSGTLKSRRAVAAQRDGETSVTDPFQFGLVLQGKLQEYITFGNGITFEECPLYLVYGLMWDDSNDYYIPMLLCWPSNYWSKQVFEYDGELDEDYSIPLEYRDFTMTPLETLVNDEEISSKFIVSRSILLGKVYEDNAYTLLPFWFISDPAVMQGKELDEYTQGSLELSNCKAVDSVYNLTADVELCGYTTDDNGISEDLNFSKGLTGPVKGQMGIVEDVDLQKEYYIFGNDVNGQDHVLAQSDAKMTYVGGGLYEWTGSTLGYSFVINEGSDDPDKTFGAAMPHEIFQLNNWFYIAEGGEYDLISATAKQIPDPTVRFYPSNGQVIVIGEYGVLPYDWWISGTSEGVEFDKVQMSNINGVYKAQLNGNGEFQIFSNGDAVIFGANNTDDILTEGTSVEVTRYSENPIKYEFSEPTTLVFDPWTFTIKTEKGGSQTSLYVIGDNVNGYNWTLAEPSAKFEYYPENDVYIWEGEYLGTSFKINDGTWSGDYNIGGLKGESIDLWERMNFINSGDSQNIGFRNFEGVRNAVIYLNLTQGWLEVYGDKEGETADWYFIIEGAEDQYAYPMYPTVEGDTYITRVEFDGPANFKVANYGLADQYGSFNGEIINDDILEANLWRGSTIDYAGLNLTGKYQISFTPLNYDEARIEFLQLSGPDDPEIPEVVNLYLCTGDNSGYLIGMSTGVNGVFGYFPPEGWSVDKVVLKTSDREQEIIYEDYLIYCPPLDAESWIYAYLKYDGVLEFVDSTSGAVEIGASGVNIAVVDGEVVITGLEKSENVVVYTIDGRMIGQYKTQDAQLTIRLDSGAAYVVRVGDAAAKVVL